MPQVRMRQTKANSLIGDNLCRMTMEAGVPGLTYDDASVPRVGDLYFRIDGGVGTTMYRCTSVGPVVWTALAP